MLLLMSSGSELGGCVGLKLVGAHPGDRGGPGAGGLEQAECYQQDAADPSDQAGMPFEERHDAQGAFEQCRDDQERDDSRCSSGPPPRGRPPRLGCVSHVSRSCQGKRSHVDQTDPSHVSLLLQVIDSG